MGSDFANFHAGCHGPVPLRCRFRGPTSRKRSRTINQSQGRESTGFSDLGINRLHRSSPQGLTRSRVHSDHRGSKLRATSIVIGLSSKSAHRMSLYRRASSVGSASRGESQHPAARCSAECPPYWRSLPFRCTSLGHSSLAVPRALAGVSRS